MQSNRRLTIENFCRTTSPHFKLIYAAFLVKIYNITTSREQTTKKQNK